MVQQGKPAVAQQSDEVAITLNRAEWAQVLNVLVEVPYRIAAPLINKVTGQIQEQALSGLDRAVPAGNGADERVAPPSPEPR